MSYLMRAALGALLLSSLLLLLVGCEQKYSGEVAGHINRIEYMDGKCPYYEVEVNTGSRLGYANVRSTTKPDIKEGWNYVLVWTATNKMLDCTTYTLRVPYERDKK